MTLDGIPVTAPSIFTKGHGWFWPSNVGSFPRKQIIQSCDFQWCQHVRRGFSFIFGFIMSIFGISWLATKCGPKAMVQKFNHQNHGDRSRRWHEEHIIGKSHHPRMQNIPSKILKCFFCWAIHQSKKDGKPPTWCFWTCCLHKRMFPSGYVKLANEHGHRNSEFSIKHGDFPSIFG